MTLSEKYVFQARVFSVIFLSLSQERQQSKYAHYVTRGAYRVETGETLGRYIKFEFHKSVVECVVVQGGVV